MAKTYRLRPKKLSNRYCIVDTIMWRHNDLTISVHRYQVHQQKKTQSDLRSGAKRLGLDEIAMRKVGKMNLSFCWFRSETAIVDLLSRLLDIKQVLKDKWRFSARLLRWALIYQETDRGLVKKIQQSCQYCCRQISRYAARQSRVKCKT